MNNKPLIPLKERLTRWEFWPMHVFNVPLYLYYLGLSIKNRNLTFFSLANPGMFMGGLAGNSKYESLVQFPDDLRPLMILVRRTDDIAEILEKLKKSEISFPLIAKPDAGQRGLGIQKGVEKIADEKALEDYLQEADEQIVLQELVELPLEFGVFYVRIPGEQEGRITSLMQRQFLTVTGDGVATLEQLIQKHERAKFYYDFLYPRYQHDWENVIEKDKTYDLGKIGNHCRGTKFINANNLVNKQLVASFDGIARYHDGFYYGRFDVKAKNLDDLYQGKVKILELNGVNSEPAHVYDPQTSVFRGYRDIFRHWYLASRIAGKNRTRCEKVPVKTAWKVLKQHL